MNNSKIKIFAPRPVKKLVSNGFLKKTHNQKTEDVKKRLEAQRKENEIKKELRSKFENALSDEEKEEIKKEAAEKKVELQEKREENKKRLEERRREIIKAYMERILTRLNAAIERLEKIGDRLSSRLDKLEEKGVDVSAARALLENARQANNNAKEDLVLIKNSLDAVLEGDNPKTAFEDVRALLEEAKTSVREAHKALVEAIKTAKASVKSDGSTKSDEEENNDQ